MAVDGDVDSKRLKEGEQGAPSSSSRRSSADGSGAGGGADPEAAAEGALDAAAAAWAGGAGGAAPPAPAPAPAVGPAPAAAPAGGAAASVRERCRYIPLRLKLDERRLLRLLEAALNVSEYTDKVGASFGGEGRGGLPRLRGGGVWRGGSGERARFSVAWWRGDVSPPLLASCCP
jgi:hypothetical protein